MNRIGQWQIVYRKLAINRNRLCETEPSFVSLNGRDLLYHANYHAISRLFADIFVYSLYMYSKLNLCLRLNILRFC